jgi:hypothetical protein
MRKDTGLWRIGRMALISLALAMEGCSSNSNQMCLGGVGNNCQQLPPCPAGATCGGPCSPDSGVTMCALGFGASCGQGVIDAGYVWLCEGG